MKKIIAVSLVVLAATAFNPVRAEEAPSAGPSIEGDIMMNVQAADNINAAVGNKATASQKAADILNGNIKGGAEMTEVLDANINAAVGNDSEADQEIGSIGE